LSDDEEVLGVVAVVEEVELELSELLEALEEESLFGVVEDSLPESDLASPAFLPGLLPLERA